VGTAYLGKVSWPTLVVQVGRYVVDPALGSDPEHFQLVFCILVGRVWGRSIQVPVQGVTAEMPMYICS